MGIRLSHDEAWEFLADSHTGILSSLRADGRPIALPVWFVVLDRTIYVRTPNTTKKLARIQRDDRVSFLVESGEAWIELKGVVVDGRASIVQDEAERARVADALRAKYASHRRPSTVPDATKRYYESGSAVIRIVPDGRLLSWDNAKLRLKEQAST